MFRKGDAEGPIPMAPEPEAPGMAVVAADGVDIDMSDIPAAKCVLKFIRCAKQGLELPSTSFVWVSALMEKPRTNPEFNIAAYNP